MKSYSIRWKNGTYFESIFGHFPQFFSFHFLDKIHLGQNRCSQGLVLSTRSNIFWISFWVSKPRIIISCPNFNIKAWTIKLGFDSNPGTHTINVVSCLAHYYWTLILSENFWLTEFLIALHCSWPLFQNVKFMQFPLLLSIVDLIGKWDSSWFGPKSENADLISVITHTHKPQYDRRRFYKNILLFEITRWKWAYTLKKVEFFVFFHVMTFL